MDPQTAAIAILRQSFLRRVNFNFDGGSGTCFISGDQFSTIADLIDNGTIAVSIDPNLDAAGAFENQAFTLRSAISGRADEAVIAHEAVHAILYNISDKSALRQEEEAACYIVNLLYYLMTGLSSSRWATGSPARAKILHPAKPLAYAVLNANVNGQINSIALDPDQFQRVVAAVRAVPYYSGDDYQYARL